MSDQEIKPVIQEEPVYIKHKSSFFRKLFIAFICFMCSPISAFANSYCRWNFDGCTYHYHANQGLNDDGHYITLECYGDAEEYGDSWGWIDPSDHSWDHYSNIAEHNDGFCR